MSELFKFPEYEQHPVAIALMPGGMDDTEFEAFCEDVEARGVIMPVTLYEGKVLDGWHRYRAARKVDCGFKTLVYEGKDPAGYIASVNVLRRKLGSLQRALVGCRLHRDHGFTQRDVCKKLSISNEVIAMVLRAIDSKNAKLVKRIEQDADFTRGMLREELEDAGLLRAKKTEPTTAPNSVFDTKAMISQGAATAGLADILGKSTRGATDGSDEDEVDFEPVGDTGKRRSHPERKPRESVAQQMSEQWQALMADEKRTFLQMIWPTAREIALSMKLDGTNTCEVKLAKPVERRAANTAKKDDTPLKALKRAADPKPAAKKVAK